MARVAEYDAYAREFSDQRAGASLNRLVEEPVVRELVGDPRGLRVLDAGCGDGSYARWLAEGGAHVRTIDASSELIAIAEDRTSEGTVEYAVHDLTEALPFADASFDLALCTLVTEYIEDIAALMRGFARVLAPGGRLVLSCDHPLLAGIVKNEQGERVLVDYFGRAKRSYAWFSRSIEVYSHTLEDYARALFEAGFSIDALREPTPIQAAFDENPELAERAAKIPTVLVIEASLR